MKIIKVKSRIADTKVKAVKCHALESAIWKPEPTKTAYYVAPAEQWSEYNFICSGCGYSLKEPTPCCPRCKRKMTVGSVIM